MIPGSECFDSVEFDRQDSKLFQAERYGGIGTGMNGGGARCGNHNGLQIKGLGKNCLAGKHTDHLHSYGGLSLISAVVEVIYTNLLSGLMPLGAAQIYGVIVTGEKTSYYYSYKTDETLKSWGALLVRGLYLRPAHFVRAGGYCSNENMEIPSDKFRTKRAHRKLKQLIGEDKAVIQFFGHYLANLANQFAFARMARISHGAVAPGNIALNGCWLDLELASFIKSGENGGGLLSSFQSEPDIAIQTNFRDLLYLFKI